MFSFFTLQPKDGSFCTLSEKLTKSIEVNEESYENKRDEEYVDSKTPQLKTEDRKIEDEDNTDYKTPLMKTEAGSHETGINKKKVLYESRKLRLKVIDENPDLSGPLPEGVFILKGKAVLREEIS